MRITTIDNNYSYTSFNNKRTAFRRSTAMKIPDIYEKPLKKHAKWHSIIDKVRTLFSDGNKTRLNKTMRTKFARYGNNWKYEEDICVQDFALNELRYVNKTFADKPELLRNIYLKQDYSGKVAAHYADDVELKVIHDALKDQPDAIRRMHLTQSVKGKLPAHKDDAGVIREINRVFESDPKTLEEIYTSKTPKERYPIHYQTGEGIREIIKAIKNPEILYEFFKSPKKFYPTAYSIIREVLKELSENPDIPFNNKFQELIEKYK